MDPKRTPPPDFNADSKFAEAPAWAAISGSWKQLYGDYDELGVSIEWHEFTTEHHLDWSRSFHPGSLEICLNYSGKGKIRNGETEAFLAPDEVALYAAGCGPHEAVRFEGHVHRFVSVEFSAGFLHRHFASEFENLLPEVRGFVEAPGTGAELLQVAPMNSQLLCLRLHLVDPPVNQSAREVWYQSKILEIASQVLFKSDSPAELFCQRHHRLNRDRIDRIKYILERDYENPPSLELLAKEADCSAYYLSRIFAQYTGSSMPKYIRQIRIEKATELLKMNQHSITDIAMRVGYTSLSAFNKAFLELIGCSPSSFSKSKGACGAGRSAKR